VAYSIRRKDRRYKETHDHALALFWTLACEEEESEWQDGCQGERDLQLRPRHAEPVSVCVGFKPEIFFKVMQGDDHRHDTQPAPQ
jgi:hypothetical protein